MSNALLDFYRCPPHLLPKSLPSLWHLLPACPRQPASETSQIIDYLRRERYALNGYEGNRHFLSTPALMRAYYHLRPLLGVSVRKYLQRLFLGDWRKLAFPRWPVDTSVENLLEQSLLLSMRASNVERMPFIWFWPNGAMSSVIITHDVETSAGLRGISGLQDIDDAFNIRASYQLVPEERYYIPEGLRAKILSRGCEVNIQDLNHDGRLFSSQEMFFRRAPAINDHLKRYGAQGFRSGSLYRNVEWYGALSAAYDMSVPNVAHLEPQRGGCCTVFPYFIGKLLELPLTTIQDYSLFHILGEYSTDLWKEQISLITQKHGLASFIIHPDYLKEARAVEVYRNLLAHLAVLRRDGRAWIALPGDVNRWWRERSRMKLVSQDGQWKIAGSGHERAQVAYARVVGGQLTYCLDER